MAVRSARLVGPQLVNDVGVSTYYTCPAGKTALLKDFHCTNTNALQGVMNLYVNGSTANFLVDIIAVAATGATQRTGQFLVLEPGDTLRATASRPNMILTVSGAELDGVA